MPDRLRSTLPQEVAGAVLREVDAARAHQLPAETLEHLALELAARDVSATDLIDEIMLQHRSLRQGREALRAGGRDSPMHDEIEAAAAVLRKGVDDTAISAVAAAAPADRSLAVPLLVVSSLMDRGLPADDVMAAMHIWLDSGATDTELNDLAGRPQRPELTVIRAGRAGQGRAGRAQRPLGTGTPRRPSGR